MLRRLVAVAVLTSGVHAVDAQPSGELIERTLALVGGQPITLSDVHATLVLGLIDDLPQQTAIDAVTERLIERALVLREVERYAPQPPPEEAVQAGLDLLASRFPTSEAFWKAVADVGYSERQLRAWVRDDLRTAAYLQQRFSAGSPERQQELLRDWIGDLRRRTPVVKLP